MSRPPLGSTLDIFGLSIQWYSLLIIIGIVIGIFLALREEKRLKLPKDTIVNFALLAIPMGVIGARLYYVIFTWSRYADDFWEIFRIWNGGLAIYGGILGAILAALIIVRVSRGKVPFWSLLDACVPSLVIAQSIGRWGNYANMEAYGDRITNAAAQFFPIGVEIPIVTGTGVHWYWHMATFFYESMWCLVIFIVLMAYRKRMKKPGDMLWWYVLLYGAGRTVIEGLRTDSLMINVAAAQVRVSQVLSALACVAVIVMFFLRVRKARKKLHLADYLAWGAMGLGIACTFVGEFERNAYQMLFTLAQILMAGLLVIDVVTFVHYMKHSRRLRAQSIWMLIGAGLCLLLLLTGIGRLGESNGAFVAMRQVVAMLHVVLAGAWFYLRIPVPRPHPVQGTVKQMAEPEEVEHATTA